MPLRLLISALLLVATATWFQAANAGATAASIGNSSGSSSGGSDDDLKCVGKMFNPLTDLDWNNMYPITVAGVSAGPNSNPPWMYEPAICYCPGRFFGMPTVGVGMTYWEPLYLVEIERVAGCLRSVGDGEQVLNNYSEMDSEQQLTHREANRKSTRMQIHWWSYPVFSSMDIFDELGCLSSAGVDLGYMTEFDYTWQDDEWGIVYSPEAVLFANPIASLACAVDAVAAAVYFPLDALFWCAGGWGHVYPMTGNSNHSLGNFALNNLVMSKFIYRLSRLGVLYTTIGPSAQCFSHPSAIWMKSQYRVNQVAPIARRGKPLVIGGTEYKQNPPITNYATQESTVNFIWQGRQCCSRF